jgi:hypothetical protein
MAGLVLHASVLGARFGMGFLMALVILKLFLREKWIAVIAYGIVQTAIWTLASYDTALAAVFCAAITTVCAFVLVRYGMLALIVGAMCAIVLMHTPLVIDGRFYSTSAWMGLAAVMFLAVLGGATASGVLSPRGARDTV